MGYHASNYDLNLTIILFSNSNNFCLLYSQISPNILLDLMFMVLLQMDTN